jgi:short-subunit dehydrogenase
MTMRTTQRIAVITGASSGIGEALALAMAARGTHVVLAARSTARLDEVAQAIRRAGSAATAVPCDLSRPDAAPFESEGLEHLSGQLQVHMVAMADSPRASSRPASRLE